jgi:hypothetical protein
VADFFCGSGTTPQVAVRLGRRFIAADVSLRAIHTTRSRLVNYPAAPFSIQVERGLQLALKPQWIDPAELPSRNLLIKSGEVWSACLPEELLPDLDYWEVDPDWNGVVFSSAAQATRRRGAKSMPSVLALPPDSGQRLCFRMVSTEGEIHQFLVS